ncbi:hypothetical protein E2C01_057719 [Portunus trituberculatus]|uniref:Uncharacterized protein n=1 Tax=Portunus trituberculatus TaxID=210409 RepID=A0A5B7H151_PORTR|nr:hypothetical protein [Portunus trituberculatus]
MGVIHLVEVSCLYTPSSKSPVGRRACRSRLVVALGEHRLQEVDSSSLIEEKAGNTRARRVETAVC